MILLLIVVVRTSASDCLEDRLRNDLQCVERDVKTLLTHSLTLVVSCVLSVRPSVTRMICGHIANPQYL